MSRCHACSHKACYYHPFAVTMSSACYMWLFDVWNLVNHLFILFRRRHGEPCWAWSPWPRWWRWCRSPDRAGPAPWPRTSSRSPPHHSPRHRGSCQLLPDNKYWQNNTWCHLILNVDAVRHGHSMTKLYPTAEELYKLQSLTVHVFIHPSVATEIRSAQIRSQ